MAARAPRFPFLTFLIASAAIVGTALGSQYLGGLSPCELCLLERWPYYIAIIVAAFGFAAYHVAVEQHWIAGPTACTGGLGQASSPDQLLQMLQARQPVQCDVVQWSMFGLSLAGLNLIASLLLVIYGFVMARRGDRS